jgi:hypothetical protein
MSRKTKTREYKAWIQARHRCNNPNSHAWCNYGARGIKVKFSNFDEFFEHIGPCPDGMSLDRINNDGHYEHGNVRWTDRVTQMNNRNFCVKITHRGMTMTVTEWSRYLGVTATMIFQRLQKWKSIEQVLDIPPIPKSLNRKKLALSHDHGPPEGVPGPISP